MSENDQHQVLMQKINKWFSITATVQIIFAIGLFIVYPIASVISFILLILMCQKTRKKSIINVVWHCFVLFGFAVLRMIQEFFMENEGLTYLRYLGNGRDLVLSILPHYIAMVLMIDAALIPICIRSYYYAKDNEYLKQFDGYPYFTDRTDYGQIYFGNNRPPVIPQDNLPQNNFTENKTDKDFETTHVNTSDPVKNINTETDSIQNSQLLKCFKDMMHDIKSSIIKKPENCIDYSKITAIIIILMGFLNLHPSSIFFAMVELFLLIIALVYQNSNRILLGFIMHIIGSLLLFFAGNLKTNAFVFMFLIILNVFQTAMYFFAYKQCIKLENMKREEIRMKYADEREQREYQAENNYNVYRSEPEDHVEKIDMDKKISLIKKEKITMDELFIPDNIVPDNVHQNPDVMQNIDI